MRDKIKFHSRYIIWIGMEKVRLIGDIVILTRGIIGTVMWHPLSVWERRCYVVAGTLWLLSFIVPIILHGNQIIDIFQSFERSIAFWKSFGQEIIYVGIWYTILTTASWIIYLMSKPSQIKKLINYWKWTQ